MFTSLSAIIERKTGKKDRTTNKKEGAEDDATNLECFVPSVHTSAAMKRVPIECISIP